MLSILASVSQEERKVISERIKDTLAHKKATHERIVRVSAGNMAVMVSTLTRVRRSRRSSWLHTSCKSKDCPGRKSGMN